MSDTMLPGITAGFLSANLVMLNTGDGNDILGAIDKNNRQLELAGAGISVELGNKFVMLSTDDGISDPSIVATVLKTQGSAALDSQEALEVSAPSAVKAGQGQAAAAAPPKPPSI